MVESRWAMATVVRPFINGSRAVWTYRSLAVSRADVASSRISSLGWCRITLAMDNLCLSPPDIR